MANTSALKVGVARIKHFIALVAVSTLIFGASHPSKCAYADTNAPPTQESAASDKFEISSGSGFFITEDGFFVTNYHVVEGAEIILLHDVESKRHKARLVDFDKSNDLAILKADGKFKALPIITTITVKRGQAVATVGYPHAVIQGIEPKVTAGIINSLTGYGNTRRLFQISVPLQAGNSGGPLLTMSGNVVGVVAEKLDSLAMLEMTGDIPQNVNYAVKSDYLLSLLERLPSIGNRLVKPSAISFDSIANLAAYAEPATAWVLVGRQKKLSAGLPEQPIKQADLHRNKVAEPSSNPVRIPLSKDDWTFASLGVMRLTWLWDLSLHMDEDEVLFRKGKPDHVHVGKNPASYSWAYFDGIGRVQYMVTFEGRVVTNILHFIRRETFSLLEWPEIKGIEKSSFELFIMNATQDELAKRFGTPSRVLVSDNGLERVLTFDRHNFFAILEKNKVTAFGIYGQ